MVTIKWKRLIATCLSLCMLITSVGFQSVKTDARGLKKGWNIDIYMCGSNLESESMCGTKDILEIMKAKNVPDNVQITIQTGGSRAWYYDLAIKLFYQNDLGMTEETISKIPVQNISADYIQRYHVKFDNTIEQDGKIITYPSLELVSENEGINNPQAVKEAEDEVVFMSDAKVLESFVKETASEYENNALVFWNHGGGTEGGVCNDEYSNDSLSLLEIDEALSKSKNIGTDDKFDMIGYDACLMATFETLAITSRYAKYCASSMTLEPGDGWYYTPVIQSLSDSVNAGEDYTGKELAASVVDAYNYYYLSAQMQDFHDDDAFMVAYDMEKMPVLISLFNKMALDMSRLCASQEMKEAFVRSAYQAREIDIEMDLVAMDEFLDKTISFAEKYRKKNFNSGKEIVLQNCENCLAYVETATALKNVLFDGEFNFNSCLGSEFSEYNGNKGLSFYFPQRDSSDHLVYAKWQYDKLEISPYYAAFVYNIAYHVAEKQNVEPILSVVWNNNTKKYKTQVSNVDEDYIAEVSQKLFVKINGKRYEMGSYKNFDPSKKTQYFKKNNKYMSLYGSPLQTTLLFEDDDYAYYYAYMMINGEYTEVFLVREGSQYYLDYMIEPGDTLAATATSVEGKVLVGKKYTITENDLEDEVYQVPIKFVKAKDADISYNFQATTLGGWNANQIVDHSKTLAFAGIKATLSKKVFKATGKEIRPQVTVKMGKKTLKKGKDYKLVYENNIAAGTATVKVVGLGVYKYAAVKTLKYTIKVNYNRAWSMSYIPMAA